MSAVIIDGKEIALQVRGDVAAKVSELKTIRVLKLFIFVASKL